MSVFFLVYFSGSLGHLGCLFEIWASSVGFRSSVPVTGDRFRSPFVTCVPSYWSFLPFSWEKGGRSEFMSERGLMILGSAPRYATTKFKREGIRLLTQHHVERVEEVRGSFLCDLCSMSHMAWGRCVLGTEYWHGIALGHRGFFCHLPLHLPLPRPWHRRPGSITCDLRRLCAYTHDEMRYAK